jgi:general secretion pathway protein F
MPAYTFEALDANGSTRKGVIEADTAKAARGLLRAQLLVPMVLQPVSGQANNAAETGTSIASTTLWSSRVFNATALAIWTRQIAGLVASGLPLERALTALSDESDDNANNLLAALRGK